MIDVAPTVLEVAGLPEPMIVNSGQQAPMEGVSMAYSFDDAKAVERHELQYFEMFCNRGIYHKGWSAVTRHSTPWTMTPKLPAFDAKGGEAKFDTPLRPEVKAIPSRDILSRFGFNHREVLCQLALWIWQIDT